MAYICMYTIYYNISNGMKYEHSPPQTIQQYNNTNTNNTTSNFKTFLIIITNI